MHNPGPVLEQLIADPNSWYHISLNEILGGTLEDQMSWLREQAELFGYRVQAVSQPNALHEGGFYARLVR